MEDCHLGQHHCGSGDYKSLFIAWGFNFLKESGSNCFLDEKNAVDSLITFYMVFNFTSTCQSPLLFGGSYCRDTCWCSSGTRPRCLNLHVASHHVSYFHPNVSFDYVCGNLLRSSVRGIDYLHSG
jgi:hypothetical protein